MFIHSEGIPHPIVGHPCLWRQSRWCESQPRSSRVAGERYSLPPPACSPGEAVPRRTEEGCRSGGRQLRQAYIFLTERLFRQAQEQGALDPQVDARGLAVLFVSLMVGLHVLSLELGESLDMKPVPELVDELLERFAPGTSQSKDPVDDDTLVTMGGSK
jgi:hypothetical protein